jgi:hypothetical protein
MQAMQGIILLSRSLVLLSSQNHKTTNPGMYVYLSAKQLPDSPWQLMNAFSGDSMKLTR